MTILSLTMCCSPCGAAVEHKALARASQTNPLSVSVYDSISGYPMGSKLSAATAAHRASGSFQWKTQMQGTKIHI